MGVLQDGFKKMTSGRYFTPARDFTPSKWKEITLKIHERHKRKWERKGDRVY